MENKKIEKRTITHSVEVRADNDRMVEGYALLYDSRSQDLGGFVEVIDKTALEGVIERSDVFALLNHNDSRGILARSKQGTGSLILDGDSVGLRYMFEAPRTALGDELLEYLKRGDITGSSFAFSIAEDEWTDMDDGRYLRTIKRFERIYDVSPVWNPAYLDTSVAMRSMDELKNHKDKQIEEYFRNLRNSINNKIKNKNIC